MPRYVFDVHDSKDMPDAEGTGLPDRHSMPEEAVRLAGEVLRDLNGKFSGEPWTMAVRDESGRAVLTLRFSATES